MSDPGEPYDVAVIGGGINGAGIARDAALRGLRVILLEQNDACSGTSAWSSRLIHGGLRYLEYGELPLVFESLRERIALRRIAPHLVAPIRIRIPIYAAARRGPLLIRLGLLLYDLLSFGKKAPGHDMLSRDEAIAAEPGLRAEGLRGAASYSDAQVTFAERLVLENLLSARDAGASIRTYSAVTGLCIEHGGVAGLSFEDRLTGETGSIAATTVVNAAGPWVDAVLRGAAIDAPELIGGTKGSHIIVGHFDGAPADAYYVEAESDGRPFFIIPWNGQFLIGTTDIRYDGDPGDVRASPEEIDYLLAETNRVFPSAKLGRQDIHYAYAGVRPLPQRDKGPESAITRRHIINVNTASVNGLVSIIGGKLTTYRNLAEQAVDGLGKQLRRKLPACRTAALVLPGASGIDAARDALLQLDCLSAAGVERLLRIYGGRAAAVAELAASGPDAGRSLDAAGTILAAEVTAAIRSELPRTLTDIVYRRMMVGLDADQGRPLYEAIAAVAGGEWGWDADTKAAELAALRAYSDSLRGKY